MTILSFTAIFAGLGAVEASGRYGSAAILVLGVFLGSALWWLSLSGVVGLLRTRFTARAMRWVNWISGVTILGFGLVAVLSVL